MNHYENPICILVIVNRIKILSSFKSQVQVFISHYKMLDFYCMKLHNRTGQINTQNIFDQNLDRLFITTV